MTPSYSLLAVIPPILFLRTNWQKYLLLISLGWLLLGPAFPSDSTPAPPPRKAHVCVYGATPAGIAAAIAAAKSGKQVLLVEPTPHIGGLLTSGLSFSDYLSRESLSGSFLEFSQRVKQHYVATYGADAEQVRQCRHGTIGEPSVNRRVLEAWLAEYPAIELLRQTVLDSVTTLGREVQAATFSTAEGSLSVSADLFIDATYEGDLMAQCGVAYRVGREGQDVYGESLAPAQGNRQLQGYNFRFCATDDPDNRAPVLAPPGYQREDFLAVVPILESGKIEQVFGYPGQCIYKAHVPALPNGKYDINDVSNGLVRLSMPGRNQGWPEGDAHERQRIFDEHLRYSVGLLYFIQNDVAVPAALQAEARTWGWCLDEFTDNGHLPPQLYVREARRMQGRYVYTQRDSEYDPTTSDEARAVFHPESISMSDYGNNCHGTTHEGPLIGGQHQGEFYNPVPPYQVPYGVLLPREYDNLLVPVAVSSSHVGFCALRFEPTWMSLGQAAGHAAALAHSTQQPLSALDVSVLQQRLHADKLATIYTSDVLPDHSDFAAVQWWGARGGLHGLHPRPTGSPRGTLIEGQYFTAAPGHSVGLDTVLTDALRQRWLQLAEAHHIPTNTLQVSNTRGQFIREAFLLATRTR